MTKMNFDDKTLERLYRSCKWARNNSLQIFALAKKQNKLAWCPEGNGQHSILYQFQCLATTTDTYYRKLSRHKETRFGVLVGERTVFKQEIPPEDIEGILKRQIVELEDLFRNFTASDFELHVQDIQSIINHEYLHQGQLVVMFRSLNIALPDRFREAFDL